MKRKLRFTLLELLIVAAILGILMSLLLPSLNQARRKARLAVCKSSLKQAYSNCLMYTRANDYLMPDGLYQEGNNTAENSMEIKPSTFEVIYGEGITQRGSQNSPISCPENVKLPVPSYNISSIGSYTYQASHRNMNIQYNYNTAMKIFDESEWPVLSDYNMLASNWSVSNHNISGVQTKAFNTNVTSEGALKAYSIGGNSAYIDGAVSWIYPSAMTFYYEDTTSTKRGMYKLKD